jgi:EmrB/QacA subfamily drug resistance transporter
VILGICCLSLFIVGLDNTVVNVALPAMGRALRTSVSGLQWVIDGYTMVLASLLMCAGATADRFGRRRVLKLGFTVFTIGSALCSVAPGLGWLIAFRVLQATGGSMLTPVAMSILSGVFTRREERTWAIGVWVSALGAGMALGPVLGGMLTGTVGWRGVFWVNLPVGLIAILLTSLFVPESRAREPRRQDPVAQVLVIVMLGSLIYAIIEGAGADWRTPAIRELFGVAVTALVLLVVWELRRREPMIDPRFFRSLAFSGAVLTAICAFACLSGFLFLITLYLQDVRGLPALSAGLHLLPAAAAIALCPALAAWLAARTGPRIPLMLGGLALTLSMAALSRLTESSAATYLTVTFAAVGFGLAMIDGQISNAAVSAMPPGQAGLASGIASAGRQVGQALGVAVSGSLLDASMHGPVRPEFVLASRPAWSVLTGCGFVVVLLGLVTARARGPRPVFDVPRQETVPRETAPQPPVPPQWTLPPAPEWVPRYLMNPQPFLCPAPEEAVIPVSARDYWEQPPGGDVPGRPRRGPRRRRARTPWSEDIGFW